MKPGLCVTQVFSRWRLGTRARLPDDAHTTSGKTMEKNNRKNLVFVVPGSQRLYKEWSLGDPKRKILYIHQSVKL